MKKPTKKQILKKEKRKKNRINKERWRNTRSEVIERDENECQICKTFGIKTKLEGHNLQIHHILPKTFCRNENKELFFDKKNLLTICWRHHYSNPEISPHLSCLAFCEWFKKYKKEEYFYLLKYVKTENDNQERQT